MQLFAVICLWSNFQLLLNHIAAAEACFHHQNINKVLPISLQWKIYICNSYTLYSQIENYNLFCGATFGLLGCILSPMISKSGAKFNSLPRHILLLAFYAIISDMAFGSVSGFL